MKSLIKVQCTVCGLKSETGDKTKDSTEGDECWLRTCKGIFIYIGQLELFTI